MQDRSVVPTNWASDITTLIAADIEVAHAAFRSLAYPVADRFAYMVDSTGTMTIDRTQRALELRQRPRDADH